MTRCESYTDFCNRKAHLAAAKSQEFKIFVHGASKRGTRILKLLVSKTRKLEKYTLTWFQEEGVFHALDGRVLQSVQFFLTSNVPKSGIIHEAYTLKIRYADDGLQNISVKDARPSVVDQSLVLATCLSFKRAIRILLRGLRELGDIPGSLQCTSCSNPLVCRIAIDTMSRKRVAGDQSHVSPRMPQKLSAYRICRCCWCCWCRRHWMA